MLFRLSRLLLSFHMAVLLLAGCKSPPPAQSTALSKEQKTTLTKRAKPPQTFGITATATGDGATFSGAFRQYQNNVGNLELLEHEDARIPGIAVNNEKARLLVDTAAAESWLSVDAGTRLNMMPIAGPDLFERKPRHVYDEAGGFAAIIPTLSLDKATVGNAIFYIRNVVGPLDTFARGEDATMLDGVLGADALRSFEFVRISLKSGRMIVSSTSVYPYPENAMATVPLINVRGGLGVEAMIDGEKIKILIDLAGRFEMATLSPASPLIRQVTIGDAVFRQVEVISALDAGLGADSPMRIGRKLLERYDLVINQRGKQLLFERPTE